MYPYDISYVFPTPSLPFNQTLSCISGKCKQFWTAPNSYVPSFQQHLIIYAYELTIADP